MQPDDDRIPTGQTTATIPEAARILGISEEAVRGRIKRGTLKSVKVEGRTHALLDADRARRDDDRTDAQATRESESSALTSALEARIESLERQQELLERQLEQANERDRENRRLLAAALERIPPQLEAGTETPPEAPERPSEGTQDTGEAPRPSLWRRLFGG